MEYIDEVLIILFNFISFVTPVTVIDDFGVIDTSEINQW